MSGSLFFAYNCLHVKILKPILALYYVTFQCGRKNIFRKILKSFFAYKKLKKPPEKVAYLSRISVVSEIFLTAQQAKTAQKS